MSPFDPMATLDEIQRLVPGYDVSRMNFLAGNDRAHNAGRQCGPGAAHNPGLIVPANNNLFSSGTLGRYSRTLNSVMENHQPSSLTARSRRGLTFDRAVESVSNAREADGRKPPG